MNGRMFIHLLFYYKLVIAMVKLSCSPFLNQGLICNIPQYYFTKLFVSPVHYAQRSAGHTAADKLGLICKSDRLVNQAPADGHLRSFFWTSRIARSLTSSSLRCMLEPGGREVLLLLLLLDENMKFQHQKTNSPSKEDPILETDRPNILTTYISMGSVASLIVSKQKSPCP